MITSLWLLPLLLLIVPCRWEIDRRRWWWSWLMEGRWWIYWQGNPRSWGCKYGVREMLAKGSWTGHAELTVFAWCIGRHDEDVKYLRGTAKLAVCKCDVGLAMSVHEHKSPSNACSSPEFIDASLAFVGRMIRVERSVPNGMNVMLEWWRSWLYWVGMSLLSSLEIIFTQNK